MLGYNKERQTENDAEFYLESYPHFQDQPAPIHPVFLSIPWSLNLNSTFCNLYKHKCQSTLFLSDNLIISLN